MGATRPLPWNWEMKFPTLPNVKNPFARVLQFGLKLKGELELVGNP